MHRALVLAMCVATACAPVTADQVIATPSEAGGFVPLPIGVVLPRQPPLAVTSFMREHYFVTIWARDEVVGGELENMRAPLLALAAYPSDGLDVVRWQPWLVALQAAASRAAKATTLEAAAENIGAMAATCGECHRVMEGGPLPLPGKAPVLAVDGVAPRMSTHAWAHSRLWEGLTAPSDKAWLAGALALANLPTEEALRLSATRTHALAKVRAMGESALTATSPQARAAIYGALLATCGHCHVHTQ